MVWFKVDDNMAFHQKMVAAGNAAVGLWTRAGSWCMDQLTDGFVPDHMIASLGNTSQAKKLVDVGLWHRVPGGYQFHQFNEDGRQPTRADVEAKREAETEKKRRWRESRAAQSTRESRGVSPVDNSGTDPGTPASVPGGVPVVSPGVSRSTRPDPTRPDPDFPSGSPPVVTWGGSGTEADARASNGPLPPEPPLCRRHIGWDRDAVPPCPACGRLREQWQAQLADADRPPPRPTWCGTCDEETRLLDIDDRTVARCPRCHPASLALTGAHP